MHGDDLDRDAPIERFDFCFICLSVEEKLHLSPQLYSSCESAAKSVR